MTSFMGAGKLGNNDVTQGPANVPPNQKVNKAEEPIYLSINIALLFVPQNRLQPNLIFLGKGLERILGNTVKY